MAVMEWNDKLDIGVDEMNNQHKGLLKLMNQLHDAYERGDSYAKQAEILGRLGQATIDHFTEEEAYMESIGFDGLEVHKLIHKDLLDKFTKHVEDSAKNNALTDNFFVFLKVWLTAHIMGIDTKYAVISNLASA